MHTYVMLTTNFKFCQYQIRTISQNLMLTKVTRYTVQN